MFASIQARLMVALALVVSAYAGAIDPGYIKYENETKLLQHLKWHATHLLSVMEDIRALGYTVSGDGASPFLFDVVTPRTPVVGPFYEAVLKPAMAPRLQAFFSPETKLGPGGTLDSVNIHGRPARFQVDGAWIGTLLGKIEPNPRKSNIDFAFLQIASIFQKQSIYLLDQYRRKVVNPKADINFPFLYRDLQHAYFNLGMTVYTAVECYWQIYLRRGCKRPIQAAQAAELSSLLTEAQHAFFCIRELMAYIRFCEPFAIPLPATVVELSYLPHPVDIRPNAPAAWVQFPYLPAPTAEVPNPTPVMPPGGLRPRPETFTPGYDPAAWDRRFGGLNEGYQGAPPTYEDRAPYSPPRPAGPGAGRGDADGMAPPGGVGPTPMGPGGAPSTGRPMPSGGAPSTGRPVPSGGAPTTGAPSARPAPSSGGAPAAPAGWDY